MLMVFLAISVFIIIGLIEVPGLIKKKQQRELIAFAVLLVPGMVITIMLSLNMKVPNPVTGIEFIVQHIVQYVSMLGGRFL
ncbi:hypothetical protein ASZ90_018066 [hydrocarbon metagenome]|uniref:Uncharacterized protein n=1 Tax=hydrocarbon metagenome TaxID=938273 RepID=A0A0W8E7F5_9ZZZZ